MMFQRRGSMIIKPIWRSNSYRSLLSSKISRRSLLQRYNTTQFSSTKICSHHVPTLSLYNNDQYNAAQQQYQRNLSLSYINNRQYSQSSIIHLSSSGGIQQQQTSSSPPVISEAQRRSANLELDRMVHSTSRLLSLDLINDINNSNSTISEAIVNEARVALHYWSRRWYMHYHPGFGRNAKKRKAGGELALTSFDHSICSNASAVSSSSTNGSTSSSSDTTNQSSTSTDGSYGASQAEKLLNWSIHNNLISQNLFNNTHLNDVSSYEYELYKSPNLNLVNIIDTYLLDTSYHGGAGSGSSLDDGGSASSGLAALDTLDDNSNSYTNRSSKHFTITKSYITSVINATRILKQMKLLHSQYSKYIYPDTLSIKAELNVWSKRAILVSRHDIMNADLNSVGKYGTAGSSGSSMGGGDGGKNDPREILKKMEIQDSKTNGTKLYDDESYTLQGCLDQMEDILTKAEKQYVTTKDERLLPSCDWYNHILGTWARSYDLLIAIQKTKEILHGMEVYDDTKNESTSTTNDTDTDTAIRQCWASPNRVSYNSVLYCLTRDSGKGTAKEAQALLQRMKDRYNNNNNIDVKPDEVTYGSVLHALAQAGMGYEAEGILQSLEDDMDRSADAIMPTLTIYNSVLNAWANSHQHNAPWRAESILERMKILTSTKKNIHVEPDSISLSTVMMCYSRSKTRKGAEQGEQLLNEAIEMYSKGNTRMKPDSIMFNCAIQGWTNISGIEKEQGSARNNVIPAERAERLLQKMNDSNIDVRPGVQTFNIILDCWAKSKQRDSAERAVKLLRDMPSYNVAPDEVSYNSTLHAMAMSKEGTSWVKCAEDMFQEMKDNNVPISQITYHVLMNIYGKSKDVNGAVKVEELLRSMDDTDQFKPSEFSYNICMDAYARRGDHRKATSLLEEMISLTDQGNREFQPTIHSFASVVNALAKSGDVDAVPRAEAIVQKVEDLDYVSSNSILYNSLIDCLVKSRHRDNAAQAEEILLRMEDMNRSGNSNVRPNSYAYSMVLTACARSKEPGAAERANRIMLRMEQLFKDGNSDVVANSRCYSAVITAWARSNSPDAVDRAFTLIDRMEQNGRDGSPHSKSDAHCYNACIHAIAKSQQRGKARKCREVLQRMSAAKDDGFYEATPNLITYSTILNACAFTSEDDDEEGKKEAFDLAQSCFQTILSSKDMDPDVSSFTNFFVVIQRHLKHGPIRDQFAEAIFHEGCKRGKMGRQVINSFRKASPTAARKLLSKYRTAFPQEWVNKIKYDGYKSL